MSFYFIEKLIDAEVAELVDAHVSGTCELARAGSSPAFGTCKPDITLRVCRVFLSYFQLKPIESIFLLCEIDSNS